MDFSSCEQISLLRNLFINKQPSSKLLFPKNFDIFELSTEQRYNGMGRISKI